jgi:FixJ family two-component response regulator
MPTSEPPAERKSPGHIQKLHKGLESASRNRATVKSKVILSVSSDIEFDKDLRMTALDRGQIIIRVDSLDAALRTVHTDCCGVAILDLDLAGESAWEAADCLLQDSRCPPVILLTGRTEQFDLRMAVQAGAIFEKSAGATGILHIINDTLQAPQSTQAEWNSAQRVVVRWLSPYHWSVSHPTAHRFWGINE